MTNDLKLKEPVEDKRKQGAQRTADGESEYPGADDAAGNTPSYR